MNIPTCCACGKPITPNSRYELLRVDGKVGAYGAACAKKIRAERDAKIR